jgi:hypothetical protein
MAAHEHGHRHEHGHTADRLSGPSGPGGLGGPDLDPVAVALDVVARFEAGRFDEAHALFSPRLREAAPAATVTELWHRELAGRPILTRGPVTLHTRKDGLVTATVPVRTGDGNSDGNSDGDGSNGNGNDGGNTKGESGDGLGGSSGGSDLGASNSGSNSGMDVVMSMDGDGLLHGLRFAPASQAAWSAPAYVATGRAFEEREVVLGSGADAVPGTLTLPRGRARLRARLTGGVPAVVLLAGGGAFDRDETVGPNKPLKDLAWGLATRGIATLRFDKPTLVHAEKFDERGFTLSEEYLPPAIAAIRLLQTHRAVDPRRVFVLGHSAGGKVAPRVARAQPSIAGLILLAADARPMHESAVRVARHVAGLNFPGPEAEAGLARLIEQAARAADPALDPHTPAADLPFGLPAAYWLDLRDYEPVGTAATAGRPMFIAQGGRDYQVTVEHDFALWRDGLGDRPEVTCRVYPTDDHLFFPGTEPTTPASYQVAQHVDPALVTDIAAWIRSRGRAVAANPDSA